MKVHNKGFLILLPLSLKAAGSFIINHIVHLCFILLILQHEFSSQ